MVLSISDWDVEHANAVIPNVLCRLGYKQCGNSGAIHLRVPLTLIGVVLTDDRRRKNIQNKLVEHGHHRQPIRFPIGLTGGQISGFTPLRLYTSDQGRIRALAISNSWIDERMDGIGKY